MNEPYRLRYTNQIVGLFLLLLLFATIVIGVVLDTRSGYFVETGMYTLTLPQAEVGELQMGTEVMQLGRRIGQVRELKYVDDSDLVEVILAIEPEHIDAIDSDCEVTLQRKFGLGVPVLKVSGCPRQQRKERPRSNKKNSTNGTLRSLPARSIELNKWRAKLKRFALRSRIQGKLDPTLDKIGSTSDRTTGVL